MLLTFQPAYSDEFCGKLLQIMADAPSGFQNIRGEPDRRFRARFDKPLMLPSLIANEAPACFVIADEYFCEFDYRSRESQDQKDTTGLTAATHVRSCLRSAHWQFTEKQPRGLLVGKFSTTRAEVEIGLDVLTNGEDNTEIHHNHGPDYTRSR